MSFIYEKNLIDELIKAAQKADPSAMNTKPIMNNPNMAVAVPGNAPQKIDPNIDVAKKLLQNIKKEMAGGFTFKSEREDAGLYPRDLVDLDSLFAFLKLNNIHANDMLLVVPYDKNAAKIKEQQEITGEKPTPQYDNQVNDRYDRLSEEDKKQYAPYPNAQNPTYFVYKAGLIAYLRDLQSKNIQMLNPYLIKLIDQANNQLQLGMSHTPEKPGSEKQPQVPGQPDGAYQHADYRTQQERQRGKSRTMNLSELIGTLPLAREEVDFARIENFVNKFVDVTGTTPRSVYTIRNILSRVRSYFGMSRTQPLTNVSKDNLTIRKGTLPVQYFATLRNLILNVESLLNDLKSIAGPQMDDRLKSELTQQIGEGPGSASGISTQNIDLLADQERLARV